MCVFHEFFYLRYQQFLLVFDLFLLGQLGVDHAGFDIALVDGYPYVLEFNRLFGNKGLAAGHELQDAILGYLRQSSSPSDPREPSDPRPAWPTAV